jgi:hypothetical protein
LDAASEPAAAFLRVDRNRAGNKRGPMTILEAHATHRTLMMLDRLRGVFKSDAGVARALGVRSAQVFRWRTGQEPSDPAWDRLVDLFAVVQKLEGFYPPARIRAWLGGMNAHLGNRSPLYLIRHGDTGEVIAAIRAIEAGALA